MQAAATVEKSPLPCPFKMEWMEEKRTRVIWGNRSRGLFAV